jgi:hypothetical protein
VTLAFCPQCGAGRPPDAKSAHTHLCRNCGHEADDAYCPHCGQETRIALPTAREFLREAAGRYVALDSRLFRTLKALLTRPGFLTGEYITGRRLRYVLPARLFLVTSLVAFATIRLVAEPQLLKIGAAMQHDQVAQDAEEASRTNGATPAGTKGSGVPKVAGKPGATTVPKDDVHYDYVDGTIISTDDFGLSFDPEFNLHVRGTNSAAAPMRERLEEFNHLSPGEKRRQIAANVFRYGPYATLLLLPAFAFLLTWMYIFPSRRFPHRPRRFAAHLVYGAHNHAFLFVVVALLAVLPLPSWLTGSVVLYTLGYLLLSMRRVYGGSWVGIAVRALFLATAYAVLFALVVVGLLVAAVLLH